MTASPALEARGVSKRYRDHAALHQVDLVAATGQVHGVLGPNGAGKTTLIRIMLGLVLRDAGTVQLLGHSLDAVGAVPDDVAGFVETPAFYPYLSGRRNLALLSRLDGVPRVEGRRRTDDALEQVGLSESASRSVGGYSAGMRQRLGLAAALLRSPRLLFLDEPTSALDPAGARDTRALVRRLADQGTAVVFSSHDMAEVEALCDVITVIDRGHVLFSGTIDTLRALAPSTIYALRTSDDRAALDEASHRTAITVTAGADAADGLEVSAERDALDAYVIALGRCGIAIRSLEPRTRRLESLFLEITKARHDANDGAGPARELLTHGTLVAS